MNVRNVSRLKVTMSLKTVAYAAVASVLVITATVTVYALSAFVATEPEQSSLSAKVASVSDTSASSGSAVKFGVDNTEQPVGLFVTRGELDRAKTRAAGTAQPFRSNYDVQASRANAALSSSPSPFYMTPSDYTNNLRYAWGWSSCPDSNPNDNNSLQDAVTKLESQGDTTRTLAMQYALTGSSSYGNKAKDYLLAWATGSTPINMYDFFVNTSTFDGGLVGDNGTTCQRPWNMALDGLFQGYGLINFSDAYLLLTRNGYSFTTGEDASIRAYLRQLAGAVNSSYHAWSVWADKHGCTLSNQSETCIRYRSDNHLSWGQASILAAAAALSDQTIADYVLAGGVWDDGRSGPVANTSHMKYVINRAILSTGQIYDEAPSAVGGIERDGYAFYHLWAMHIAARVDDIHFGQGLWDYTGTDGQGIEEAYVAEAPRLMSGASGGVAWQYELVYNRWPNSTNLAARNEENRNTFIVQSYGPVVLLFGQ